MSLLKKYVSFSLLTITAIILFQGCQCSSRPDPNYSPFPVDGWGVKYFSTNDTPIESKKWAYYYRKAYYRNGKPDPDSLAVDHYMTGEKKSQGYLISENPDKYNGERIDYYRSGALEKQYYKNGVPTGEWPFYLEDGSLSSMMIYKEGIRQKFIQYKNGKKERDGIYKNGVFYQDIYYYPNGRIERKHTYENSNQDSFFSEEYYESGKIKSKGKFVKAPDFATSHSYKPIGDFYYYDESGHRTTKNYDPKPIQPRVTTPNVYRSNQRSSTWERGYSYGWDAGYEDAINGSGAWASYNESGKGGDFLDGYNSGYIDGYENGKNDRDEDDEEIEDL